MVLQIKKPEDALKRLMEGNQEYINSRQNPGDISPELRQKTVDGQKPYAIIITCSDSRVIPEAIFSAGIGELFVIRVAGNVIDKHQLGSIQYAAEHLGSGLVMVLGHTNCGAVDAAINHAPEGYIRYITDEIVKAIGSEKNSYKACCLNVQRSLKVIRESLNISGENPALKIVGAVYHLEDGKVELLPEQACCGCVFQWFLKDKIEYDNMDKVYPSNEKGREEGTMALKSSVERAQRAAGGFTGAKKHIVIQYGDKEQPEEYLLDLIRRDIAAQGISDGEIQEVDVYVKPEEAAVYYVLNKEIPGKVAF